MAGIVFSKNSGLNDDLWKENDRVIRSWMMDIDAENTEDDALVDALSKKVDSDAFGEKFGSMTEFGDFEAVDEGDNAIQDDLQAGPSKLIEHQQFLKGFSVTAEMMEDNKIWKAKDKAEQFVRAYKRSRAKQLTAFLTAGNAATTYTFGGKVFDRTCADGKALFATDHPGVKSGVAAQSNVFTNGLGTTEEALYTIANYGMNFMNGSGENMGFTFDTIVLPSDAPKEIALVKKIIGSEKAVGTNFNDINTEKGEWKLIINKRWQKGNVEKTPFLLMSSEFNRQFDSIIHMDRIPLKVSNWVDHTNENLCYNGRYRFSVGAPQWQGIIMGGAASGTTISGLN